MVFRQVVVRVASGRSLLSRCALRYVAGLSRWRDRVCRVCSGAEWVNVCSGGCVLRIGGIGIRSIKINDFFFFDNGCIDFANDLFLESLALN